MERRGAGVRDLGRDFVRQSFANTFLIFFRLRYSSSTWPCTSHAMLPIGLATSARRWQHWSVPFRSVPRTLRPSIALRRCADEFSWMNFTRTRLLIVLHYEACAIPRRRLQQRLHDDGNRNSDGVRFSSGESANAAPIRVRQDFLVSTCAPDEQSVGDDPCRVRASSTGPAVSCRACPRNDSHPLNTSFGWNRPTARAPVPADRDADHQNVVSLASRARATSYSVPPPSLDFFLYSASSQSGGAYRTRRRSHALTRAMSRPPC